MQTSLLIHRKFFGYRCCCGHVCLQLYFGCFGCFLHDFFRSEIVNMTADKLCYSPIHSKRINWDKIITFCIENALGLTVQLYILATKEGIRGCFSGVFFFSGLTHPHKHDKLVRGLCKTLINRPFSDLLLHNFLRDLNIPQTFPATLTCYLSAC